MIMSLLSFDKILKIVEIICKVLLRAIGVISPDYKDEEVSES